jgi:sigma-B regulation protein RsbU (phosphoserine phosphatase)
VSTKPTILVIDDEPGMLRAIERILAADHHVTTSASPIEALELAQTLRPDLVICDISMPKLDGFEVMSRLKERQSDVEIILMTGLSEPDQHLVRAIREKAFYFIEKPFNRDVMRTLVERCLELRRLRQSRKEHTQRMERELAEARTFQQTMLPATRATVEGIDIAARYVACTELCGDLFDYAPAGTARAAVLIADVSGHGVSAALLTAVVTSAFRSASAREFEPRYVVQRVVDGIRSFSDRRFVTLIAGRIDRAKNELLLVNAGHPAAMLQRGGEITQIESTGPMISPAFADADWEQQSFEMKPGDNLLLYTDGVTESHGLSETREDQFRADRVLDVVRNHPTGGDALIDGVLSAIQTFASGRPANDDLTLLTAKY